MRRAGFILLALAIAAGGMFALSSATNAASSPSSSSGVPSFVSVQLTSTSLNGNAVYRGDSVVVDLVSDQAIAPPVVSINSHSGTATDVGTPVSQCPKTTGGKGTPFGQGASSDYTCTCPSSGAGGQPVIGGSSMGKCSLFDQTSWEVSLQLSLSEPAGPVTLHATPVSAASSSVVGTTVTAPTSGSLPVVTLTPSPLYCMWSRQFNASDSPHAYSYNNFFGGGGFNFGGAASDNSPTSYRLYVVDPLCEPQALISLFSAKTASAAGSTSYTISTKSNDSLSIDEDCGFLGFSCDTSLDVRRRTATSTSGSLPAFLRPGDSLTLEWQCQPYQDLKWVSESSNWWGVFGSDSSTRSTLFRFSTVSKGTGFDTGGTLTGSVTINPQNTTKYSLSCGSSGYDLPNITINVDNPQGQINASPSVVSPGGNTTLYWSAQNVVDNSCTVIDSANSVIASNTNTSPSSGVSSGSLMGNPGTTVVYTLACQRYSGESVSWQSNPVTIANTCLSQYDPNQPDMCAFSADPAAVLQGGQSTLSWYCPSSNTSYAIDKQEGAGQAWGAVTSGSVTASKTSGTRAVNPLVNTNYRLTCSSADAMSIGTATVSVNQPALSLSVNTYEIALGKPVLVSWSAQNVNANSCKLGLGNAVVGTGNTNTAGLSLIPGVLPATYTLTCQTPASVSKTAPAPSKSIMVYENGKAPKVTRLYADPASVRTGGSTKIYWTGTNLPKSCTLSSQPALPGLPSTVSSTPTGNSTGVSVGPINQKTSLSLFCEPTGNGTTVVNLLPQFQEI